MAEQQPPEPPPKNILDEPLSPALNEELMRTFQGMPAALEAMVEGNEGPIDIPAEQAAEAYQRAFVIVLNHLPRIAAHVDVIQARLIRLEKQALGENPDAQ